MTQFASTDPIPSPNGGAIDPIAWPTLAQSQGQRGDLAGELRALRASSSWRLTAPLRALGAWRQRGSPRTLSDYEHWLIRHLAGRDAAGADVGPLFSVLMPVFNPPLPWLEAAIASVRGQGYARWELCIADDASSDTAVRPLLDRLAVDDSRIRWTARERNGHISAASNSALALARGDWMVLLDQDDLLAPGALARLAQEINAYPQARLIYSDEDKVDEAGRHYAPYFKPDWNPELLRSQNYVSHLGAYHLPLVRELGGFRGGFEGAQDHDLVLRVAEQLAPHQVRHIPEILYHWRAHRLSTAESGAAKGYAQTAALRALHEHAQRLGRPARVMSTPYGFRTQPLLQAPLPTVTVLLRAGDGAQALEDSLAALRTDPWAMTCEYLLVDGAGAGETPAAESSRREPLLHRVARVGGESKAALCNRAASLALGDWLLWLDAGLCPLGADATAELLGQAQAPDVAVVGGQILDAQAHVLDGARLMDSVAFSVPAFAGQSAGDGVYFNRAALAQQFSAVSGRFAMVRRSAFLAAGGFDDNAGSPEHAFTDLCLRLGQAGWRIVWTPYAESVDRHPHALRDVEGEAQQKNDPMIQRWRDLLSRDPAHNPNLAPGRMVFDPSAVPELTVHGGGR